jgi:MFS transporter, Spinster family, sphingosine-1-phosphate transporter
VPSPTGADRPEPSRVVALVVLGALALRGAAAPASEAMRPELWLTDRSLGWTTSGFALALLAAAAWIDLRPLRRARPALPAVALAVAALLALATLRVRGPWTLLLARVAAGGAAGIAVGAAVGRAREAGARAAAAAAAVPGGLLLAAVAGGALARLGWRASFAASAAVALASAAAALRARARAGAPPAPVLSALAASGVRPTLGRLRADRPRVLAVTGAAAWALAASALATWLPAFLERVRQVPRGAATLGVGAAAAALAFAGALLGAAAVRGLAPRTREAPALAAAIAAGGAAIAATGAIFAWRPALYLSALLGTVLLGAAAAPALWAAVAARLRAAADPALAPLAAAVVLLADALAPLAVGAVSHRLGLWKGMLLVPLALGAASALLAASATLAARAARRDAAGAADQERPSASA